MAALLQAIRGSIQSPAQSTSVKRVCISLSICLSVCVSIYLSIDVPICIHTHTSMEGERERERGYLYRYGGEGERERGRYIAGLARLLSCHELWSATRPATRTSAVPCAVVGASKKPDAPNLDLKTCMSLGLYISIYTYIYIYK